MVTSFTDCIDVVRGFLPRIQTQRAEAERARRMSHELIRDMARAGIFRLKAPERYGGAEIDHLTYHRILEEVSRTDASVAWLIMIANEGAAVIGYLPEALAEDSRMALQELLRQAELNGDSASQPSRSRSKLRKSTGALAPLTALHSRA